MRSVVSFEAGSIFNLAPAATRCEASGQYQCMTDAVIDPNALAPLYLERNILQCPERAIKPFAPMIQHLPEPMGRFLINLKKF